MVTVVVPITFKNGEAYWWGLPGGWPLSNPAGGDQKTQEGSTVILYATLAAVQATGEYPEAVREAAGKFIEASSRVLAERYSDGESDAIRFIDPSGKEIFRSGNHSAAWS
jgi:hypothetical protein